MSKRRRRFSREFKLEAVRQLTSGRQLAQVARELGVDAQVIRRWKDQVAVDAATAFPGNGRVREEDAEVQRLRREVTQLRAERDFLKKATAAFFRMSRSIFRRATSRRSCVTSASSRFCWPTPGTACCGLARSSRTQFRNTFAWTRRSRAACAIVTPRSTTSRTASTLNSRLNRLRRSAICTAGP